MGVLVPQFCGCEDALPSDGFGGGIAKHAFCGVVPGNDFSIECPADDGVVGVFDDGRQLRPRCLGVFALADIAVDDRMTDDFSVGVMQWR